MVISVVKTVEVMPSARFDSTFQEYLFTAMQWLNIVVPAGVVHVVLIYRQRLVWSNEGLAAANTELETSNEELAAREEEISRQNEELQSQTQELVQQSEELQTQTEELRTLNEDLAGRESTLQMLLQLAGPTTSEPEVLHQICGAAPKLLGEDVAAVAILERCNEQMVVRSHSEFGSEGPETKLPAALTVAAMAMERMQAAQLEDTQMRPDLVFPQSPSGETPRSILSVPLSLAHGPAGALEAYASRPRRWTDQQVQLLQWLAGQCSRAWESVRLRDELKRATAAAEAANMAKSRFLANMSHELRTPMNAILGMIDVALPKAKDPMVQDCLQTAKGSADLLLTLLNDLLDSAKIESGKLELESAPFSLRRMLDQIAQILSVRASEKGLCLYCRTPEGAPDAVMGDRMRLQQVLLNLAGNAIKFTERGDVEISLHALSQDDQACLRFTVRDTGIGISPAGLEHLFQPFAQADASMSRRFGGTGLGLSICKSLVEMMGGRIGVDSELGKGSTFYFTVCLPLAKELPAQFDAPVTIPTAACAPLRILLVEDNPANQKLASYVLEDRGHKVEIAGDGQEAVCLTRQNYYDVILMDVQMPGMNGLEATAAIRNHKDGRRRVPIIAMTAHALKGDRDHCLAAGMDGYLSKPVNAQEMIA
jgi:signal transduction histidine kinase